MNNIDIKDRATSLFARLKVYAVFLIRYIVFIGRKYPLIAALFLLFYAFFFFRSLNLNTSSNLPISNNNLPLPNTSTYSNTQPNPTPVIEAAQATAIKNGSTLVIRFSKPVKNPTIAANGKKLDFECQERTCNVNLSKPLSQINLSWWQESKLFKKDFRF